MEWAVGHHSLNHFSYSLSTALVKEETSCGMGKEIRRRECKRMTARSLHLPFHLLLDEGNRREDGWEWNRAADRQEKTLSRESWPIERFCGQALSGSG